MQLTALPAITLRDLAAANVQSVTRTPGCHVTDITSRILKKIAPERYGKDFAQADSENWQESGFMWEEILSAVFAARAIQRDTETRFRPGELSLDGIIGSPDALVYPGPVLEEYKCTWKSSRNFDLYDKRYLGWLLQMQAYCKLADTLQARLFVLHINGNYEGYIPAVSAWQLQFSQREIDDQWLSLKNTARAEGLL